VHEVQNTFGRDHMVSCKRCGKKRLAWRETLTGFKLCDDLEVHQCDKIHYGNLRRRKSKNP